MWAIPRRIINVYKGEFQEIIRAFLLGKVISGESVGEFENGFAEFIGVKRFFALSSGRASLKVILEALGIPEGCEVIIPAYTAQEVPATVLDMGLIPVFVDIKFTDNNIDPKLIEGKVTAKTKAIIPTHLFGVPCDMEPIVEIAQKYNLTIIEDCAHAVGAVYKDTPVGNFGRAAFFSFANSKPFNTLGGGGIATNDSLLAEKIALKIKDLSPLPFITILKSVFVTWLIYLLTSPMVFSVFIYPFFLLFDACTSEEDFAIKVYDKTFKKSLKSVRNAAQISNLQAMIGIKHLNEYKSYCKETSEKFGIITRHLKGVPYLASDCLGARPVPYFFVVQSKHRKEMARHLLRQGIDSGHFLMRYCPKIFNDNKQYPVSLSAIKESLQIPMHRFVDHAVLIKIASMLNQHGSSNE